MVEASYRTLSENQVAIIVNVALNATTVASTVVGVDRLPGLATFSWAEVILPSAAETASNFNDELIRSINYNNIIDY